MESTPDTSPAKRSRAKSKVVVKAPIETRPAAAKKPRAPRKTLTTKAVAPAPATDADVQIVTATLAAATEDVGTMIATAAYYLAASRNFSPGHELDDWLEAERAIHGKLYSGSH